MCSNVLRHAYIILNCLYYGLVLWYDGNKGLTFKEFSPLLAQTNQCCYFSIITTLPTYFGFTITVITNTAKECALPVEVLSYLLHY